MRRSGSRNRYYVKRIPSDVKSKLVGVALAIPVGDTTQAVTISSRAQAIRISLRTGEPGEVKSRQAEVDAYLENIWRALREDRPTVLSQRQATALAQDLYRAWADGEDREQVISIEEDRGVQSPAEHIYDRRGNQLDGAGRATSPIRRNGMRCWHASKKLEELDDDKKTIKLEELVGPIIDSLLLAKGIHKVDQSSREILLLAFMLALRDAFEHRRRNAIGDYTPDPKAQRFPAWIDPKEKSSGRLGVSLKGLVESWWQEAQATGRKPSTHESYSRTVATLVQFLGHDDASRVTKNDVVRFKDHRLASVNPRNGRRISPQTVKDSDLAGLKSVFGWAVTNGKLASNPAESVTIKLGKRKAVRRGFRDDEALKILAAATKLKRGGERPQTFAAKRWVPWLLAYSGARVGEMAQLRKEDLSREGKLWVMLITPEAGTVKNDEPRRVVVHPHLVDMGFIKFVQAAPSGYLFLRPATDGDVLGPLQGVKNRLAEFVRTLVSDKAVDPNHGWRHRFKSVCRAVGIDPELRDHVQGHSPRSEGERYGEMPLKAQAAAIAKLPRYKVGS
jgi:integrase